MEQFIPVNIFQEKGTSEVLPFPRFDRNDTFVWTTNSKLPLERKREFYRYFVNGKTQSLACFRCETKIPVPFVRKLSPKFP